MTAVLRFLVLAELLGLAALPLASLLLARLPGRGAAFAKPLGLLLAGWLVWLLASLGVSYGTPLAVAGAGLLVVSGAVLSHGRGVALRELIFSRAFWVPEAVFLAAFAAMALLVSFAPDVWNSEKPMDMALINAINAGSSFPPHNPWLSGEELEGYYYFGHLLGALAIRLTGVEPTVGYNLCLALLYGLAASGAYGLGACLAAGAGRPPVRTGLAAVALTLVLGNLAGALPVLRGDPGPYRWFEISRVVPDTINEFPFFSWVVGDLHAHLIAVPFTFLALAFALQWALTGPRPADVVAAGVVSGLLYAINSWSYPVVTGLLIVALIAVPGPRLAALARAGLLLVAGGLAVAPFLVGFEPPASGLGLVSERRPLGLFLRDHALMYGLLLWLLAAAYALLLGPAVRARRRTWLLGAAAVGVAGIVLAATADLGGALLVAAAAAAAAAMLLRPRTHGPERFMWLLAFGGLTCVALPEVVFVRDAFAGGPFERMNTVFKLGHEAWLLLGPAAAGALALVSARLARPARTAWLLGAAVLALGASVFAVAGTNARTNGFAGPPRLDGLQWLRLVAPGDVEAIAWLRENTPPGAVVMEAVGDDYSSAGQGRISTFSGRPAVIAWSGHVLQWGADPGTRRADVDLLYRTPDPEVARDLLDRYDIDYVVLGDLERTTYGELDTAKWDTLGRRVFTRGATVVWRVNR